MSQELRAAANEICDSWINRPVGHALSTFEISSEWLARAWLADHPADDEQAIDAEWLLSIGFIDVLRYCLISPRGETCFTLVYYLEEIGGHKWGIRFPGCEDGFKNLTVRGDVRTLCRSLKIEIKEKS